MKQEGSREKFSGETERPKCYPILEGGGIGQFSPVGNLAGPGNLILGI